MNIVVITGASSGMGREFAMQLDRGLHSVDEFWLIARRGSRLKEIASGMQHTVKILPLDLKARVAVVSDSAEAIVELVTDSPDIIGLLPLPAVPPDLTILPITLPSLALDVHLQTPEGPNPIATALRRILCDQFPA